MAMWLNIGFGGVSKEQAGTGCHVSALWSRNGIARRLILTSSSWTNPGERFFRDLSQEPSAMSGWAAHAHVVVLKTPSARLAAHSGEVIRASRCANFLTHHAFGIA
jgi:hypothetical protein